MDISDVEVDQFINDALSTAEKIAAGDAEVSEIMSALRVDQRTAAADLSRIYSDLAVGRRGEFREYTRRTIAGEDEFLAACEIFGDKIANRMKERSGVLFG